MFTLETRTGGPIDAHGARLFPVARSARLEIRGWGWVWNRAIGVEVEAAGGRTRVPIRDLTRQLQIGLLVAGLAGALWLRRLGRRRLVNARKENPR